MHEGNKKCGQHFRLLNLIDIQVNTVDLKETGCDNWNWIEVSLTGSKCESHELVETGHAHIYWQLEKQLALRITIVANLVLLSRNSSFLYEYCVYSLLFSKLMPVD
jgi:hypothetical protein